MKAKLKNEYHKPDLEGWDLAALETIVGNFRTYVTGAASEALACALQDEGTYADWPAIYGKSDGRHVPGHGKKRTTDPLTIYVTFALSRAGTEEGPVYSFNLADILQDEIANCAEDGSWNDGLSKIEGALRKLADDIGAAITAGNQSRRPTA